MRAGPRHALLRGGGPALWPARSSSELPAQVGDLPGHALALGGVLALSFSALARGGLLLGAVGLGRRRAARARKRKPEAERNGDCAHLACPA